MTEITFCRPVHQYDSYTDFWRLVELSGFPIIRVDEMRLDKPGVFITAPMNGDYREYIDGEHKRINEDKFAMLQSHLILWNIERPSGNNDTVGKYGEANRRLLYGLREDESQAPGRYCDEIWVSDRRLADETTMRYVTLGSDYGLGETGTIKPFDYTHMSVVIPRRQSIYHELSNCGPNCWPPERNEILKESRFALNVHQDNHPFQEPLRFALFAAYGLPVLSEYCYDAFPFSGDTMVFASYDGLVSKLKQMLKNDYSRWRALGLRAQKMMCEDYQFGKMVRQAVKESVGDWR